MKLKTLLFGTAFTLGALLATADERTFGNGTLPAFLQEYDVNENGKLDLEEQQAFKADRLANRKGKRAKIDTDGDGQISDAEKLAARVKVRREIFAKRKEMFLKVAGEDEVISFEEFASIPRLENVPEERVASLFARLDADEDGSVTFEEFVGRLRPTTPPVTPRPPCPTVCPPPPNDDGFQIQPRK